MMHILIFICLAPLIAACAGPTAYMHSGAGSTGPRQMAKSGDGWQADELIVRSGSEVYRIGTTPGGVEYQINERGTAMIGGFLEENSLQIGCTVDPIDDHRSCNLLDLDRHLSVFYMSGRAASYVCVIGHDFPGMSAVIRVDQNKAVFTGRNGCVSADKILPQLVAGNSVAVRRYKWPYQASKDVTETLEGFADGVSLAQFLWAKGESLAFLLP